MRVPATALLRFWTMLAHYHGQTWNAAEPARALGVNPSTSHRYLDLLTDALMVRQLQPWYANLGKRQVKSPKVYVRDSGLLHQLLGLESEKAVLSHPKAGASWEGFAIEQVLAYEPHDDAYFWATHQGAEIDLILRRGDQLFGVECKRADEAELLAQLEQAFENRASVDAFPSMINLRICTCGKTALPTCIVPRVPGTCRGYAADELIHSRASFHMFQALLRSLEHVPGRKTLFLFTQNGGLFPREYYLPESRTYVPTASNNWTLLQAVAADAVSSRTVINTINAGRPQLMDETADQAVQTGWSFAEATGGDFNREATGSFALLARSTLRRPCVYRIGLSPSQAVPGKTYGIRVQVAGQILPHRYRIQRLTAADRISRHLAALLYLPRKAHAFPLFAAIRPLGLHGNKWRVELQVGMGLASLFDFPLIEGPRKKWDIASLFSQVDGSRVWEFSGQESLPSLDTGRRDLNAVHEGILEIKPGSYQLRAAVHDAGSDQYAATQIDLQLPRPKTGGIIGPLCTWARTSVHLDLPRRSAHSTTSTSRVGKTLLPCCDTSLPADGPLLMETWICSQGQDADTSINIRGYVDRNGIPFYRLGSPRLNPSGTCLQIDHIIDTDLLSPGRYTYHVLVPGEGKFPIELGTRDFTLAGAGAASNADHVHR